MSERRTFVPPSGVLTLQGGLVRCDACNEMVSPRGDHYSVHFASLRGRAPCPRSYPPQPEPKAKP